ncbi:tRNA pseudouridine synthase A [bacterium HR37]|nr:tRNA pseudouridine synthase A [bacterium HR37]
MLVIEYDGTNYLGWQKQPQGPTIQDTLERTLERITGEKVAVIGSGRTDSGVHALGQVANFKTESRLTPLQFQRALNSLLPKDIVIVGAREVEPGFHAQFDAKSKVYVYRILNRPYPSALERFRVWFVPNPLDVEEMKEALELFRGEHDFRAFALSDKHRKGSTVRRVINTSIYQRQGNVIEIEIEANGFLKGMVRLIVGALSNVGRKRISPKDVKDILESGKRSRFVFSAPPWGLFLKEVKYQDLTTLVKAG